MSDTIPSKDTSSNNSRVIISNLTLHYRDGQVFMYRDVILMAIEHSEAVGESIVIQGSRLDVGAIVSCYDQHFVRDIIRLYAAFAKEVK